MPRGDQSSYTGKQKREAEHIEEGYEKRGFGVKEAARRAWATVNAMTGGGKKSAKKGGRLGGAASAKRSKVAKSKSAKKATTKRAKRGR